MKKGQLLITGLVLLAIAIGLFLAQTIDTSNSEDDRFVLLSPPNGVELVNEKKEKEQEGIKFWEWFSDHARANQETGDISMENMTLARKQHAQLKERVSNRRASNLDINFEFMGPDNMGGRTRDILFDKDNPSRVYTGGVSGGLYISDNGGSSWKPYLKNDTLAGIGVVSLAQATNGDIYVGTGEYITSGRATGVGRARSFIGEGIWKSTDGGNSFFRIPSTAPNPGNNNNAEFAFVNEIVTHPSDPNIILAGTATGLLKSTNGGDTWEDATTNPILRNLYVQDLAITSGGTVHLGAGGRYWKGQIDDAGSYSEVAFGASFRELKIGVAPSDENYLYAIGCDSEGRTTGLFRSTDGGDSWRNIGPGSLPTSNFNPTGTQGYYDMEIAVHPENKDIAYTAGQFAMYEYNYSEENGNPKDHWWPISNWWSRSPAVDRHYVHADHHRMVFHPNNPNTMYVATDGGIYRTKNADSEYPESPTFEQLNKGYGVAQFNNISTNLKGQIIGGTQDNGVLILDFKQNEPEHAFRAGGFGDGGYCEASKLNENAFIASSYFGILGRSANGGTTFSSFFDNNIDCEPKVTETLPDGSDTSVCSGDGLPDGGAPFVPVSHLHEYTDSLKPNDSLDPKFETGALYFGPFDGVWVAYNALGFGANPTWFRVASNQNGLHSNQITFTAMNNSADGNYLFAGTSDGYVYRISGLNAVNEFEYVDYDSNGVDRFRPDSFGIEVTQIGRFPGRFVTDIAVDKNDPEHVVVALGNYGYNDFVYRSTNAVSTTNSNSFSSIQGNLPQMPVYSILIDIYESSNIVAGTELGVYSSSSSGGSWEPEFNGLPTTPVLTLNQELVHDIKGDCYILYAGTYGKSIYASTSLSPAGCTIPRGETSVGIAEQGPNVANEALKAYPNPARDVLNLEFTLNEAKPSTAVVYNLQGQQVKQQSFGNLPGGTHKKTLGVNDLSNGNYIVVVRSGNNQAVSKVMISK